MSRQAHFAAGETNSGDQAARYAKPPSDSLVSELLNRILLAGLRTIAGKHGCEVIAVSEHQSDRVLLKHDKFVVEADRQFAIALIRSLFSPDPEMLVGEGFMYRRWRVHEGALEDVLSILWKIATSSAIALRLRKLVNKKRFRRWQINTPERAARNIEHHYDADNPDNVLFRHMLGRVPCYSAAIFDDRHIELADAQKHKIETIVRELKLRCGSVVLDIGSGWGVLTRRLASEGHKVTGITLSREQLKYCKTNLLSEVTGSEEYFLQDYRSFFGSNHIKYSAVTCIEVLDHIGKAQFDTFFRMVDSSLKSDGTFFLQLIARPTEGQTAGWIQKHIYPGGYIASLDEVIAAYQSAGFCSANLVRLPGSHYAQTLREWRTHFQEAWSSVSKHADLDELFYRKWMFFFAYSISAFENAGFCNYHLTLKKRI